MKPEISVIIPAYNRENLIGETIKSLLAQTHPAMEILVVDDGSTDATAEVAERFGEPVRVLKIAHGGPSVARNTGVNESRGRYIHFFDSDDIAVLNKQEIQLELMEASDADIAYGPWIKGAISGRSFTPVNAVYQQLGLPRQNLVKALLTNWSVVPQACLFKREIIEKVGGFPEDLNTLEDQLFFLRCLLAKAKIVHTPGTLVLYRENNTDKLSEGIDGKKDRCREWALFQMKAGMACEHYGLDPSKWFGFRARAWSVARCVNKLEVPLHPDLKLYLDCLQKGRGMTFQFHECFCQRMSSVQQRLLSRRGSKSYRMGSLTEDQIALIECAGYRCLK